MARTYQARIDTGSNLTQEQISNMQHIVVNNYTNAVLSILFLIVVYSILIYGIKIWREAGKNPQRTDKETPYVPVPEGGVKTSAGH